MWYVVLGGLVGFALVTAGLRLLTSRGARLARRMAVRRLERVLAYTHQTQLIEDEEYRAAAIGTPG